MFFYCNSNDWILYLICSLINFTSQTFVWTPRPINRNAAKMVKPPFRRQTKLHRGTKICPPNWNSRWLAGKTLHPKKGIVTFDGKAYVLRCVVTSQIGKSGRLWMSGLKLSKTLGPKQHNLTSFQRSTFLQLFWLKREAHSFRVWRKPDRDSGSIWSLSHWLSLPSTCPVYSTLDPQHLKVFGRKDPDPSQNWQHNVSPIRICPSDVTSFQTWAANGDLMPDDFMGDLRLVAAWHCRCLGLSPFQNASDHQEYHMFL